MSNLNCKRNCCSATITTKGDTPKDYNIDLCSQCMEPKKGNPKRDSGGGGGDLAIISQGCYGTKGYTIYQDRSIQAIGGKGNPTRRYMFMGDHSRGHKYRAHCERNHGHKYKVGR